MEATCRKKLSHSHSDIFIYGVKEITEEQGRKQDKVKNNSVGFMDTYEKSQWVKSLLI